MRPFTYVRAGSMDQALREAAIPGSVLLAGGTTMVDLMRGDLASPARLVDIGHLESLDGIETGGAVLRFGALARMADAAEHPDLRANYPALAESLQLAASQQLRNAATLGGNVLQRTRCGYFRDGVSPCNKRAPGSGCAAQGCANQDGATIGGEDREMALFGTSDRCIATYPGDWGTALAAFDTALELRSATGSRTVPLAQFHCAYGDDPARETVLEAGEIITAITVRATPAGRRSAYVKVRDRHSYAYALVSAAVALELQDGLITSARVALGGVASRPWRAPEAEAALLGQPPTEQVGLQAGEAAFEGARPRRQNTFKVELGRRAVARAVLLASRRG